MDISDELQFFFISRKLADACAYHTTLCFYYKIISLFDTFPYHYKV